MSRFSFTEFGLVQRVTLDGQPTLILLCPGCGMAARMDDDQARGRVSVDHATDGCPGGYHETHDYWAAANRAGWLDGDWNEAVAISGRMRTTQGDGPLREFRP